MNLDVFVENVLKEFDVKFDKKKFEKCYFMNGYKTCSGVKQIEYLIYPFSAQYPYLIIILGNANTKDTRQCLYVDTSSLDDSEVEDFIANFLLYDFEKVSQIIADRLVELFPFLHRAELYEILEDILHNCASVLESYKDPRFTLIEKELGVKEGRIGYSWIFDDDDDFHIDDILDDAIYRFMNELNATLSGNLAIKIELQDEIKRIESLDRNDVSYQETMDKFHTYLKEQVDEINDSLIAVKHDLFYEKAITSLEMDLYLFSIVENSRKAASSYNKEYLN